jgi:hypothetical protein
VNRDTLFLLDPYARVEDGFFRYCPDCAFIEGYLALYPIVRTRLAVVHVTPTRPRAQIVALLGEANQGAPVLVLHPENQPKETGDVQTHNGLRFINDPKAICRYLALELGGGLPL